MNKPAPALETSSIRAQQAADWFLRLRENSSEEETRDWLEWCNEDLQNLREFERVRITWGGIGALQQTAEELLAVHAKSPRRGLRLRWSWFAGADRDGQLRQRRISWPIAAAIALSLALASTGLQQILRNPFLGGAGALAAQAANRSATLPDGSTLTLAPRTNVAVDFTGATRSLDLSRGEAYFKVHPNKQKPFVVQAEGLKVTALGTAFSVRSEASRIVITVEEGLVEAAAGAARWRVGAGYRMEFDLERQAAQIAAIDAASMLAWREGRLEYFLEPLGKVVADASRYSNKQISIADPQLAQLAYTGTIFTESIDDWLRALESTFPIQVIGPPVNAWFS
jgi:transmembrane sensor